MSTYCEIMTIMCRFHGDPVVTDRFIMLSLTPFRLILAACTLAGSLVLAPGAAQAGEPVAEHPIIVDDAVAALDHHQRWSESGDPWAYLDWVDMRDRVAITAADALGLDADELVAAWIASPLDGQVAVVAAITQLGVPYRRYARAEGEAFDCSGLTSWAWSAAGIELERSSRYQYRAADRVERDEAQVGDLVYYPGHIMLFLGVGDAVVHAPTRGRTVELQVLSERSARRISFADPTTD